MFVEVSVILAGAKSSVLFLDEEERGGLGEIGRADLSGAKVFIEKFFGGEAFVRGEGVKFSNFRGKGVGEVDFVVVGLSGGNMVCCFLGEHRGELGVFGGKDGLWFRSFCGSGEFSSDGEVGDYWGTHRDKTGSASYDSVKGSVFASPVNVCGLLFPLVVFEEARVSDGVHVYVTRGASGGFKEGVVSLIVDFVGGEEEFGFVDGFVERECLGSPVDGGVGGS